MFAVDDDRGTLCRGSAATNPVPGQKPVSSIPAKFETVLFKGPREKKGFGSEGRRFSTIETENPGPGTYGSNTSSLNNKAESIGIKGYGSMASSTKRLSSRTAYTGPGPGSYRMEVRSAKGHSRASTTANFSSAVGLTISGPKDSDSPGPGAYSSEACTRNGQKLDWEPPSTHHSAFKGTSHKLIMSGNLDCPPPTKYTMTDLWDPKQTGRPTGTFAASYSRNGTSAFAGASSSSLAGMTSTMFLEDPKEAAKPDTGPGPGSYELQYFNSIRSNLERAATGKPSANFNPSDIVDRFGAHKGSEPEAVTKSGRVYSPETGHAGSRISGPVKGISSPFVSTSPGRADYNMKDASKAPGPAYYSPDKPYKKSHHLNVRKRMVT